MQLKSTNMAIDRQLMGLFSYWDIKNMSHFVFIMMTNRNLGEWTSFGQNSNKIYSRIFFANRIENAAFIKFLFELN
jgi:hypothetical protein